MANVSFPAAVNAHVELLRDGKPLEALKQFFAADGQMYSNDTLFADGIEEAREKQERYILSALSIDGQIDDLKLLPDLGICVFRNLTSFTTGDGTTHQIDGLCWQHWQDDKIVEERYYDGPLMANKLQSGLLEDPSRLKPTSP